LTDYFSHVSFTIIGARSVARTKLLNTKKDKGYPSLKRAVFCHYAKGLTLAILVCLGSYSSALSQKTTTPQANTKQVKPAPKPAFVLNIQTTPILNISLKAEKAKVSEVAQALAKGLKIPVQLGKGRENELMTVDFSELTLEPALQLLAPQVYVDYEVDTGALMPKPLGIYLLDANQGEPPLSQAVNGSTQSMLIEGNTEDGVETDKAKQEEQPLRVKFENGLLTVKAKKQPLPVVLLKIGEELGIPVEIQDQSVSIVDTEISKLPVEDVVRQLSPHIRLFLRADLTRAEKRALRLVLAEQTQATQQNL
jgi:hypothetical protein